MLHFFSRLTPTRLERLLGSAVAAVTLSLSGASASADTAPDTATEVFSPQTPTAVRASGSAEVEQSQGGRYFSPKKTYYPKPRRHLRRWRCRYC